MGAGTLKACHIIAQGETLGENPGKEGRPNPHYERREKREKDWEDVARLQRAGDYGGGAMRSQRCSLGYDVGVRGMGNG